MENPEWNWGVVKISLWAGGWENKGMRKGTAFNQEIAWIFITATMALPLIQLSDVIGWSIRFASSYFSSQSFRLKKVLLFEGRLSIQCIQQFLEISGGCFYCSWPSQIHQDGTLVSKSTGEEWNHFALCLCCALVWVCKWEERRNLAVFRGIFLIFADLHAQSIKTRC